VTTNRTSRFLAPLAATALVLSLAACGSDDDSDSSATTAVTESTMADEMASDTTMADGGMTDGDMAEMPGGEATVGDIAVTDAWVRQPAMGQTTSAAYGTIANNGDADVTLIAASVPFDATVEIHETLMDDDGTMQMQEREDGFVIPAGGTFTLEPGGPHIMMIGVDPADIVDSVDVTLVFDDDTNVTVTAPVRELTGMSDMADDDMTATTMADG
jgi:copper(I)-binding protein